MKKNKDNVVGIKSYQKDFTVTHMRTLPNGDLEVKGPIMEVGVKLGNKTVYSEAEWEKTIKGYTPFMEKRMAYGMMDHPERKGPKGKQVDLSTKLERSFGICTALEFSEDRKFIIGTFEIYRDEVNVVGRRLASFLERGTVGVSTRGVGGKKKRKNGTIDVFNFNLIGIDFVARPSSARSLFNLQEDIDLSQWDEYELSDDYHGEVFDLIEDVSVESLMVSNGATVSRTVCGIDGVCFIEDIADTYGVSYILEEDDMNEKDILEEVESNIEKEEVEESGELIENVMSMALPKKEIKLGMSLSEIKENFSAEEMAAFILKMQMKERAEKYLELPHGELLKNVFLSLLDKGIGLDITDGVMVFIGEYMAKLGNTSDNEKKELLAKISELNTKLISVENENNKEILQIQDSANKQVQEIKSKLQKAHEDNVIKTTEKVSEFKDNLNTAIEKNSETMAQYHEMLEEKNSEILDLENEVEELKLTQVSALNEITSITEQFDKVSVLTHGLLEEKEAVIEQLNLSEKNEHRFMENIDNLQVNIAELNSYNEKLIKERQFLVKTKDENAAFIESLNSNIEKLELEKNKNNSIFDKLTEKKNKLSSLLEDNSDKVSKLMDKMALLEDENLNLQMEAEIKDELIEESKGLIGSISEKTGKLLEQNEALTIESEIAEEKLQSITNNTNKVIEQVQQVTVKTEKLKEHNKNLKDTVAELSEENDIAKEEVIKTKSVANRLKIENSELNDQMKEMQAMIEKAKADNLELANKLNASSIKIKEKKEKRNKKIKVNEDALKINRKSMSHLLEDFGYGEENESFITDDEETKVVVKKVDSKTKSNSKNPLMKSSILN